MTDKNPDTCGRDTSEGDECNCKRCQVTRKLGYPTYTAWSEKTMKPIVDTIINTIGEQTKLIDTKQVEGVITPDEASTAKSVVYSDATQQILHVAAHFSHHLDQRIAEFVGEAAEHWNIARPRPAGALIPISRKMMKSLEERAGEIDPFSPKPSSKPEQPN